MVSQPRTHSYLPSSALEARSTESPFYPCLLVRSGPVTSHQWNMIRNLKMSGEAFAVLTKGMDVTGSACFHLLHILCTGVDAWNHGRHGHCKGAVRRTWQVYYCCSKSSGCLFWKTKLCLGRVLLVVICNCRHAVSIWMYLSEQRGLKVRL